MPYEASQKIEQTPAFQADIYPNSSFYNVSSNILIRERLTALAVSLQSFIDHHCENTLQGYIWQREKLSIKLSNQEGKPEKIEAFMRHGGSVEDEWLAVHLLLLASKVDEWGFRINVRDEDGQFVLIQAADVLPYWIQPSNAQGRLWIVDGIFHLISLDQHLGDAKIDVQDTGMVEGKSLRHSTALEILSSNQSTLAPQSLMNAIIKSRMPTFPDLEWAKSVQHTTLVYVSQLAAEIITKFPQIIANVAEAFEAREGPGDARKLRDLNAFGKVLLPNVLIQIKLPKRLYSTLLAERYFPPKVFGNDWRESVLQYWDILEKEQKRNLQSDDDEEISKKEHGRRRDLGCKIVCGLELAYANVKEKSLTKSKNMFDIHDDNIRSSQEYDDFIKSLTGIGYFGGEIRESSEWKSKENEALQLWRKMLVDTDTETTSSEGLSFLLEAVKDGSSNIAIDNKSEQNDKALRLLEDPDDFLYDSPVDENTEPKDNEEEAENVALQHLNAFSDKLQTFVEAEGDEVGALFEDEGLDGNGDQEEVESMEDTEENDREEAKKRFASLTMEDRERAMELLIPKIQDSEWGHKRYEMQTDQDIISDGVKADKKTTLTGFSTRNQYDGASDSDESVDDEILRAGDTDEDRLNRARSLDIESTLLQEEKRRQMALEDGDLVDEEEDWEDEENFEQDEVKIFLEFARKELGLSESQYEDILQQRREKGQSVPKFNPISKKKRRPEDDTGKTFRQYTKENITKSLRNERTTEKEKAAARLRAENRLKEVEEQSLLQKLHPKELQQDPFQKLMNSMDAELDKLKGFSIGKQKETYIDNNLAEDNNSDEEMISAQDAELVEKMLHDSLPSSLRSLLEKQENDPLSITQTERQIMENMLKSYQAQMGQAGPVSNLMGRFGIGSI